MKERIGFVGVGLMGTGMATHLVVAGHPLVVHVHRNRDGVESLLRRGATDTRDLAALARTVDVVVLCVSDAVVVRSVVAGLRPGLRAGHLVIDATSSDPQATLEIAAELHALGVRFADAPVTGGPAQAEAGVLGSLVGCDEADFADVQRIVGCYSKVVERLGAVGSGHCAKLLNNFVTQGTVALLVEAYARARELGLDWRALYAVMQAGAARSGTLEKVVGPALDGDFDGSRFTVRNAHKDLGYYCELAARSPRGRSALAEEVRARLGEGIAAGLGDRYVSRLLDPRLTPSSRASESDCP